MSTAFGAMIKAAEEVQRMSGNELDTMTTLGIVASMGQPSERYLPQSTPVRTKRHGVNNRGTGGYEIDYRINEKIKPSVLAVLGMNVDNFYFWPSAWEKWLEGITVSVSAFSGNELVGYVHARNHPENTEVAVVEEAMVRRRHQGTGIFKEMIDIGLEQLTQDGYKEVQFGYSPGTEDMYRHLGFTILGDQGHYKLRHTE